MDFKDICDDLTDRYPQWGGQLGLISFIDVPGAHPVDNDGRNIYYNGRVMKYYTPDAQSFYIAQQVLHLQLRHFSRGAGRDPLVWKRAADAVVNSMLRADGFTVPLDAVQLSDDELGSAEQVYEKLINDPDLIKVLDEESDAERRSFELLIKNTPDGKDKQAGTESEERKREIEPPGLATVIAGLAEYLEPSTQMDFDWFPGSVVRDGMIRAEFRAYPVVHAEIVIDTSASVDAELLRAFVRGVKGLFEQDAVIRVGCFDTRFYGFQEIRTENDIQNLELSGAGGTDFNAAIGAFSGDAENQIIFTDGFAEMPEQRCDAIWVVYGNTTIRPNGGRVLYVNHTEEKEKHEIDFLIT